MVEATFMKQVADAEAVWSKSVALFRAGVESGKFAAPRPLEYDAKTGSVTWEHLTGLVPMAAILPRLGGADRHQCLNGVGEALAALHGAWGNETGVPVGTLLAGGTDLLRGCAGLSACPPVLVHGDFGTGNIFCADGDWRQLVVLDPEPAPYLALPLRAVMSPALDVAHFAGCLEGVFPPRYYVGYPWRRTADLRHEFLAGYVQSSGVELPANEIDCLTGRLLTTFGRWLMEPGHSISNQLLGRFLMRRARMILPEGD